MSNNDNNNEKRINELIMITKKGYIHYIDDEILDLYDEIWGIVFRNEGNYTIEQRQKLKSKGLLEPIAIIQDGIMYERKEGRYKNT